MAESSAELEDLKQRLAQYRQCEQSILLGHQSYTTGDGNTYSRADLRTVQKTIQELQYQIANYGQPAFTQTGVRYV
ncbi:MAG: hypothetical protein MI749_15275 [Desulfovibrionales bacterium]|nr:hypothetical protein [Desulfovibrionales bacterium]